MNCLLSIVSASASSPLWADEDDDLLSSHSRDVVSMSFSLSADSVASLSSLCPPSGRWQLAVVGSKGSGRNGACWTDNRGSGEKTSVWPRCWGSTQRDEASDGWSKSIRFSMLEVWLVYWTQRFLWSELSLCRNMGMEKTSRRVQLRGSTKLGLDVDDHLVAWGIQPQVKSWNRHLWTKQTHLTQVFNEAQQEESYISANKDKRSKQLQLFYLQMAAKRPKGHLNDLRLIKHFSVVSLEMLITNDVFFQDSLINSASLVDVNRKLKNVT